MEFGQILYNIKHYLKIAYTYLEANLWPYVAELYVYIYNLVLANKPLAIVLGLLLTYLYIKSKRPKVLRKRKFKKAKLARKKRYFNTGIRFEANIKDIIKIKIRLLDYCDKKGVRYSYLFNIKLFGIEFLRTKYINQKGEVYKRKVTFRS